MAEAAGPTAAAVLRALAALSPAAEQRPKGRTIPLDWFRWLPCSAVRAFASAMPSSLGPGNAQGVGQLAPGAVPIERRFGERLAAVDQIRVGQRSLRIGWLFVAGKTTADGRPARVFHPLVTIPVRVQRLGFATELIQAGDAEITPLVEDPTARRALEQQMEFGGGALEGMGDIAIPGPLLVRLERLRRFALAAARAAGLQTDELVPAGPGPEELMRSDHLRVASGAAVFAVTESHNFGRAGSLEAWAASMTDGIWTSFHSLYLGSDPAGAGAAVGAAEAVESPYLLTPTQRAAVLRSRADPITVVSGAPGTGKSHTIVAIACDALARGHSVVVAAKSDDAVDALIDLLERAPGPDPVVFGSHERRDYLAKRLAAGQLLPASGGAVAEARRLLDRALERRDARHSSVRDQLGAEALISVETTRAGSARLVAPGFFDPDANLVVPGALLALAGAADGGWLWRWRRQKARRRLEELAGSSPAPALAELAGALEEARAARLTGDLLQHGGLDLTAGWEQLRALDDDARLCVAKWLAEECHSAKRINRSTLPSVTALATALRSGRAARREQLARLDRRLTHALPLWIGSLPDIDDLLPPLPGLFDLVILDEASSIDQPLAAAALLRASRAIIVGDPHQLRHVSFVSDDQIHLDIAYAGLHDYPDLASRLDVRRNSTFDVATGAAPVTVLDEHFRSDPHLIDWVARRIYGAALKIATRTPATEGRDCIEITSVAGERDGAGVVLGEIKAVVSELTELRNAGASSVGVISPFRAQADALEGAILSAFSADDLVAMDLRVGTVHAFQGNERDTVIASIGIGPKDSPNSWQFLGDPHLFDVLVTRARKSFRLVTSADPPAGGLVADYIQQADSPPGRPAPAQPLDPWTQVVAEHLREAGLDVAPSYPTGRHVVDLCVSTPQGPFSIECTPHPDGPEAHIERHLALMRSGWKILDAFKSKWGQREGELAIELVQLLQAAPSHPGRH